MKIKENPNFIPTVHSEIMRRLVEAAEVVKDIANNLCPVKTGATRDSLCYVIEEMVATVGVCTDYAPFIELGTSIWEGHPFLRPALVEAQPFIKQIFET